MTDRATSDDVARAQAGDDEAFRRLYDGHSAAVFTVALRVLGDRRDAEEATQDTFVSAWRHLGSYRGDSRLSTWFHRICVNRCLAIMRRRRPLEASLAVVADWPSPAADPGHQAEVRSELDRAAAALDRLPEPSRVALVLRDVADLSYEEVADVLDISLTAARSRIHRGRRILLADLDDSTVVARGA